MFSNKNFWITLGFFFILALLMSTVLLPIWAVFGIVVGLLVNIPLLILLGGVSYNWKKSTLMMNSEMTKLNNFKYYLEISILIFIVGNLLFILLMLFMAIGGFLGIFLDDLVIFSGDRVHKLYWKQFEVIATFINFQTDLILTFAIYYFINSFVKNIKNYYIIILVLIIFYIIFGAAINNYFRRTPEGGSDLYYHSTSARHMFPNSMFIPSLLFPYYGVAQQQDIIVAYKLTFETNGVTADNGMLIYPQSYWYSLPYVFNDWMYSSIFIQPYIYSGALIFAGFMFNKFNDSKLAI